MRRVFFAASVIGRQRCRRSIWTAVRPARRRIFHGALTLNQLFSARPMLGHADYRGR